MNVHDSKRSSARSFPRATARRENGREWPTSSSTTPAPSATRPSRKSSIGRRLKQEISQQSWRTGCVAQQRRKDFRARPAVRWSAARHPTAIPADAGESKPNRHVTGLDDRQTDECLKPIQFAHQSAPRIHHHYRRLRQVLRLLRCSFTRGKERSRTSVRARRSPPDG